MMSACSIASSATRLGRGENLFYKGTHGAEIVPDLKPLPRKS